MQNIFETAIIAITAFCLGFGFIWGAVRGGKRSIGRLIVVAACFIAALCLREQLTAYLLQVEVNGQTIQQVIIDALGDDLAALGDTVIILVKLLASVVVFVATFVVLQFVSAIIVTPIINLCLGKRRQRHGFLGALVGLVQGAAVALIICVPLNGLLVEVNKVGQLDMVQDILNESSATAFASAEPSDSGEVDGDVSGAVGPEGSTTEGTGNGSASDAMSEAKKLFEQLSDYVSDSQVCGFYGNVGGTLFDAVSTITENDKTYTLSGQIEAVKGAAQLKSAADKLSGIGTADFNASSIDDIKQILSDINDLPDEAKETIGEVITAVVDELAPDLPVDISAIDFTEVDYEKEGKIIEDVYNFAEKVGGDEPVTEEDVKQIVQSAAESDIILPLLQTADTTIELDEETKQTASSAIDNLDVDEAQKDTLRKLLGIGA